MVNDRSPYDHGLEHSLCYIEIVLAESLKIVQFMNALSEIVYAPIVNGED